MPKVIKKKVAKKTAPTEEEVQDRLENLRESIQERQKTILRYGALVLVIILAAASFFFYSSYTAKKAKGLEYDGYKIFYNLSKTPMTSEEQYQKSLDIFQKAYATKRSPVSLFYIAACQYELGRFDDALKSLKEFVGKYSSDKKFIPLAYQKMATLYIKKDDFEEAKKTLDTLNALQGDIFKDLALIEYAGILEKEGKLDEAKKKYQELTTKYPDSPFSDKAQERLSQMTGKNKG
ncbi:MAG: tetratricopeptide repeat protein [Nitrospirota bacterium]